MSEDKYSEYDEYLTHLQDAANSAQKALDCLYKPEGVNRGLGYKIRVGRAQDILMTLLMREINRKDGRMTGGKHEWEEVDTRWECVFCEVRATPHTVGRKVVFVPDVLRWVPSYGRKWRCNG